MSDPTKEGSAFPWSEQAPGGETVRSGWGMSLRDYFAAKALAGILAYGRDGGPNVYSNAAVDAYDFADAMLAERARRGDR